MLAVPLPRDVFNAFYEWAKPTVGGWIGGDGSLPGDRPPSLIDWHWDREGTIRYYPVDT